MDAPPFQAVLHDDDQARAAAVAALLQRTDARVVRVGNPLRAPLTMDRILMQVAGPDGDAIADDPASAAAAIAQRQAAEASVLLLVEQADTLHPAALRTLQGMLPYLERDGQPLLRVAFAGRTAFRDLLRAPELGPLRAALGEGGEARLSAARPHAAPPPLAAPVLVEAEPPVTAPIVVLRTTPPGAASPVSAAPAPTRPAPAKSVLPAPVLQAVAPHADSPVPVIPPPPAPVQPVRPTLSAPMRPEPVPRRSRWLLKAGVALLLLAGAGMGAYQGLRSLFYRDVPPRTTLVAIAPAPALVPQPGPAPPSAPIAPLPPAPPAPVAAPPVPVAPPVAEPEPPPLPVVITPPVAPPAPTALPAPTPLPGPAQAPPSPSGEQAARLRREFEAFLLRSGRSTAVLSEAERSELFDEYVEWRSQNGAASAPAPTAAPTAPARSRAAGPRIVIRVPAGSIEAGVLSGRLQTLLGARPGTVEARPVADGPARPTVVFYYPEDAETARQAAGWMADAGLAWSVRDLSAIQPRPERGVVEVWLPR